MKSFSELPLSEHMKTAIAQKGYEIPSPIQAEALPILLGEATDFIGLAATGTGKTAAFAIPLLEKLDPAVRAVQALVMCPTRELALQVAGQINLFGKANGFRALTIYGGSSFGEQIYGLKNGAQIVVATPGRLVDHLTRGTLKLSEAKVVVLDEADEMISMGFKDDLEAILKAVPKDSSNIWLFSATMSKEVRKVADTYLRKPKQVQVNKTEMLSNTVDQVFYATHESNKPEILCKLIDAAENFYGIVFCQTKSLVVDLTQYMTDRGYKVDCLHGDKEQNARERTMQSFRTRKVNLLICTDVASRGLDVKDITHVINYSIPRELDVYVHRIGRTARSGKAGIAISLVTHSHRVLIPRIEKMTKSKMREGKLPTRKEVGSKKTAELLNIFKEEKAYKQAIELMGDGWKTAIAEMSGEEIVGRFLAMKFPELFADKPQTSPLMPHRTLAHTNEDRAPRRSDGRDAGRRPQRRGEGGRSFGPPRRFEQSKSGSAPRQNSWNKKKTFGASSSGSFSGSAPARGAGGGFGQMKKQSGQPTPPPLPRR